MAVKRKRRAAPDDRFHVAGAAPRKLFLGTPLRVLDHGTHRPILFQLEEADGAQVGQWVVKPSCNFPDGPSVLLHELAGSEMCARAGVLTPAIGLLRFPSSPPRTDDTDAGREAASVFQRDAGRLAFCARYIEAPRAEAATLRRPGRPNVQTQGDAIRLFALDAFLWHYDRSAKNPNALLLEHRLVAVDHDRSFHRVHDIEESGLGPDFGGVGDAEGLREHIAFDVARNHRTHDAWRGFIEAIGKLSPTEITSLAQSWPAELDVTATGDRAGRVDDLIRFLSLRCASVATIVGEIQDALA